jgi:transposase InsO family protein
MVCQERKILPKVGVRKLQILLDNRGVHCGRDRLFHVLRRSGLLIRPRKRYIQTTFSRHWMHKYPNLIRDMHVSGPEQLWVSDLTYLKTDEGYCYLSLVTDAYSRKIMGYTVADSLDADNTRRALEMALRHRIATDRQLTHHSDRGHQYCSREYVGLAVRNNIRMSMTENGDPYENALAERMNRTIKEEFCLDSVLPSRRLAQLAVTEAVTLYNTYRPHLALGGKTPEAVHTKTNPGSV